MSDQETIWVIADQQGWSNDTLLDLAWSFIEQTNRMGEFVEYLQDVASEEDDEPDEYWEDLHAGVFDDEGA